MADAPSRGATNLTDLLTAGLRKSPGKVALRAADAPAELTYQDLFARSRRLAAGLRRLGLASGDRVGFYLGNRAEFVSSYLAVIELGAAVVPINLAYRRREIVHIVTDARPRLILTDHAHRSAFDELTGSDVASIEKILLAEALEGIEAEPDGGEHPVREDDTALVMYTSGTTGASKGAITSHGNVAATVNGLLAAWAWSEDDTLVLALPLFHTHGLIVGLHCALAAGATVVLHSRFDAARIANQLIDGSASLFFGVPTMYQRLLDELRARKGPLDLSRMRLFCSGSAPLAPETFAAFQQLTGHAILERYGMTETGMLLSNPWVGERRPGSVGTPLPGVTARIVDEHGMATASGAEGELQVAGDNVFAGYWQAPEKTAESFVTDDSGKRWFRTGDLARQDGDGYYTLLGRRTELIVSGGFNIYPREVEDVLTTYPGVLEAAVTGRPHPEWGEAPVAYLVTEGEVDSEALIDHCKRQIAAFKVPRRYLRVEALPRNALGKVQKHLLPSLAG